MANNQCTVGSGALAIALADSWQRSLAGCLQATYQMSKARETSLNDWTWLILASRGFSEKFTAVAAGN